MEHYIWKQHHHYIYIYMCIHHSHGHGHGRGLWKRHDYDYLVGGFNPSEQYQSIGMTTFPTEWEKHVPNHQPAKWTLYKDDYDLFIIQSHSHVDRKM